MRKKILSLNIDWDKDSIETEYYLTLKPAKNKAIKLLQTLPYTKGGDARISCQTDDDFKDIVYVKQCNSFDIELEAETEQDIFKYETIASIK